jgi:hypothetical protein
MPHGNTRAMSILQRFMLAALLWLPLMFFLWFWFAAPLVWPVIQLAKLVLLKAWPQLFSAVAQGADLIDAQGRVLGHPGYLMQLSTSVMVNVAPAGQAPRFGLIEPTVNPMIYGYALPLFAGLLMATPLAPRWRLLQCAVAIPLIWVAQAFGAVAESLKTVAIDAGPSGLEAAQRAGLSPDVIALCYQFGYLILPSLVPALLWIVMNQRFIEALTRHPVEPARSAGVEAPRAGSPQ